jgi:hypothetical protein
VAATRLPVPDVPVVAARPAVPTVLDGAPVSDDGAGAALVGVMAVADGPREPADPDPPPVEAPLDPVVPPIVPPVAQPAGLSRGGIRGDGTQTLVFRRPAPVPARAVLRIVGRDGAEHTVEVDGTPLTIGRASDNAVVLPDPRVSRHHARLQARRGTLVFTDLGSTNGSRLNGVRVDECALGTGDRVVLGDTVLLVEQLPG